MQASVIPKFKKFQFYFQKGNFYYVKTQLCSNWAKMMGISKMTLYRYIREEKAENQSN